MDGCSTICGPTAAMRSGGCSQEKGRIPFASMTINPSGIWNCCCPKGVRWKSPACVSSPATIPIGSRRYVTAHSRKLQKIWELCAHSLEYGVQEVIQDCMEREKGQYLGDGCFTSLSYAVLTGDLSIMEKLIDDSLRSAFVNEGLMTCTTCSFMQEIAEYSLMLPMLLRAHYQLTGDRQFLRDRYDGICRLIRFYLEQYQTENGLLGNMDKWCVVEWPAPYRDGYDFDLTEGKVTYGVHNVINAYFLGSVKTVNAIGRLIGAAPVMEPADVARLEQVFVDAFYDRERGLFRDAPHSSHISLPSNVFPLLYDLCPDRGDRKADCGADPGKTADQRHVLRLLRGADGTLPGRGKKRWHWS